MNKITNCIDHIRAYLNKHPLIQGFLLVILSVLGMYLLLMIFAYLIWSLYEENKESIDQGAKIVFEYISGLDATIIAAIITGGGVIISNIHSKKTERRSSATSALLNKKEKAYAIIFEAFAKLHGLSENDIDKGAIACINQAEKEAILFGSQDVLNAFYECFYKYPIGKHNNSANRLKENMRNDLEAFRKNLEIPEKTSL